MCVIIDTNVAHKVLGDSPKKSFAPVRDALFSAYRGIAAKLCYSSALAREYASNNAHMKALLELYRAGRAIRFADEQVEGQAREVRGLGICESDDDHILGLARASGARLLCSHDKALHKDFTNTAIVPSPKGRVYQNAGHAHLLRECCAKKKRR